MLVQHNLSKSRNTVLETLGGLVRIYNHTTGNVRMVKFEDFKKYYTTEFDNRLYHPITCIEDELIMEAEGRKARPIKKVRVRKVVENAHKENTTQQIVNRIKEYKRKPREKVFYLNDLDFDSPKQNRRRLKRSGLQAPFVFPLGVKEDVIRLLKHRAD